MKYQATFEQVAKQLRDEYQDRTKEGFLFIIPPTDIEIDGIFQHIQLDLGEDE